MFCPITQAKQVTRPHPTLSYLSVYALRKLSHVVTSPYFMSLCQAQVVNFWVQYEIDDDTAQHVLKLDEYGGDGEGAWVLLERN